VSPRTLYVRFATKPDLLKRMIDVAVVGDVEAVPLADRPWVGVAFGAPTLHERIAALATGLAEMHARLAPLVALGVEVESSEPVIARQAARARAGNVEFMKGFWSALIRDGLVAEDTDVEQVTATTMLLSAAETAVLRRRTFGEERPEQYAAWLSGALHAQAGRLPKQRGR
jgi:AcrR family transcriptional regulator